MGWLQERLWKKGVVEISKKAKKMGEDDPRRIIHSLKVGLALTLVSLFFYFRPLYNGFGMEATWAVLTVVVVLEFSVGATIGKGLNRMMATLLAGVLSVGAHHLATLSGGVGEPILLAFFVFIVAGIITFMRFYPALKARYDYGLMIFILTFCLITVSSYRDDQVLHIAQERLSTIAIGSCTSMAVCICICPVWMGSELHNSVATNLEKVGNSLQGFGGKYFASVEDGQSTTDNIDDSVLHGYKAILNSKTTEESMANFARWEPFHGKFRFRHPWKQYLTVATLARQLAYKVEALNTYLNSEIQTPDEIKSKIQEQCTTICSESGKVLKEEAVAMRKWTRSASAVSPHIASIRKASEDLKTLLKTPASWEDAYQYVLDITPVASVASHLLGVVSCVEKISEAVHELACLARFKSMEASMANPEQQPHLLLHQGIVVPVIVPEESDQIVITINEGRPMDLPRNNNNNYSQA